MKSSFSICLGVALAGALGSAIGPHAVCAEPLAYIEPEQGPRFYLGDEDARLGRVHLVNGDYGLAELHFRRAVEATPQNSAAWLGLAAAYDRLARFDLAARAYRFAARAGAPGYALFNNEGYSYLLRGRTHKAAELLYWAAQLAPGNPTIMNNIAILQSGQGYFWGETPYIWGWPPF
jgi:tetratricopeptide (TPR) repeat protein